MLHRFRVAMVRPGREQLSGLVEVDEAYVGGGDDGVGGRSTETKATVAIAVEIEETKGFWAHPTAACPRRFEGMLDPLHHRCRGTRCNDSYRRLAGLLDSARSRYTHQRIVMRQQNDPAHVVMPGVHRVASLLKRWLLGTHQAGSAPSTSTRT